ncbi:MAG: glycosyltransferase family 2 protein [Chloroflexi bacterium]|nr:glycosyltransferase family 2 protein [Chloroflexota bacterium]
MMRVIRLAIAIPLLLFSFRRLIFTLVALFTPATRPPATDEPPRDLLVLVPCRNDGASLPGLVDALLENGYPLDRLKIMLIDDGSDDDSAAIMQALARRRPQVVRVIHLPANVGKAAALNAALADESWGDVVAVYDADHRPQPGGLAMLVQGFADPHVGAVSGRTEPRNALASPAAYYSAVERLVHQRITLVAKDRLNLAPAILGSHCAYRRSLLEALGGFTAGAFLEDSDLTVRIAAAGYRTRYLESIPAMDEAPATLAGYWRQHVRWSRGFQDVAVQHGRGVLRGPLPWPLRLELFLFSLGYLDRLALLAAAASMFSDAVFGARFRFPRALFAAVLALPYLQIMAAFVRARVALTWWLRLPYVFLLFPVDVAAAVRSTLDTLLDRPRHWRPTAKQPTASQPYVAIDKPKATMPREL